MNFYIVTFDRDPEAKYGNFHKEFVGRPGINKWWHYIKSCYIIGTDEPPSVISDYFAEAADRYGVPKTHLVMKLDMTQRQGWLDKDAWAWIKKCSTSV